MRILFYDKPRRDVISDNVHITELLNNLARLGHTIKYIDGQSCPITNHPRTENNSPRHHLQSFWNNIKTLIWKTPFRGEALLLFFSLKELELLFLALRIISHSKPDLIYRRHGAFTFGSNYVLSLIFKIPCITEVNSITMDEVRDQKKADKFSLWIIGNIEKYNFRKADKYIVVTSQLQDILNLEYGVSNNKTIVIENGANTDLFKPLDSALAKTELNLDASISYVCFVGALAVWHGVDYFISTLPYILKEYPSVKALIIGEGAIKGELMRQSEQLGLSDKVIFTGSVLYEKVPLYINASDICVAPMRMSIRNLRTGASPLKLYEYLACGKPVISNQLRGLEFLEEIACGFNINSENPIEFAQAIIKILQDPILRREMGENGRKYVLENRSWEIVSNKVATACKSVIDEYIHKKANS